MVEEKLIIKAKKRKSLVAFAALLSKLGFSKVAYTDVQLVVEKTKGENLSGKPNVEYRVTFLEDRIEFCYDVSAREQKHSRLLSSLPLLTEMLKLAEDYYSIKTSAILTSLDGLFKDMTAVVDKDALDLRSQLSDLEEKYDRISLRYQELVRSSEENTKILLECERKRDELTSKLKKIKKISDERLCEELYTWLKVHNGSINIQEFARANSIEISRAEEGLEILIREGYIKKRVD
jgi:hypothetical protein